MSNKRLAEMIEETHDKVITMEEHLRNMNGKLAKHEDFLMKDCPARHLSIEKFITRATVTLTVLGLMGGVVITFGIQYVMQKLLGS